MNSGIDGEMIGNASLSLESLEAQANEHFKIRRVLAVMRITSNGNRGSADPFFS